MVALFEFRNFLTSPMFQIKKLINNVALHSSELAGSLCPLSCKWVCPPPGTKGEATLACGRGGGGANSDDLRESLALCILYGLLYRKFLLI